MLRNGTISDFQRYKKQNTSTNNEMIPIISNGPWEVVGLDVVSSLVELSRNLLYSFVTLPKK